MAYNERDKFKKQNPGDFLVSKTSELQPVISGSTYYMQRKHMRSGISLSDRFVASFDSQINPTILPPNPQPNQPWVIVKGYYDIEDGSTYFDLEGGSTYFDPA